MKAVLEKATMLVFALMLAFGSPSPLQAPLRVGTLSLGEVIKVVHTKDGDLVVWRDATGCTVVFQDIIVDRVDLATCRA